MIVWLASYPRSGNTYSRSILNHYFGIRSFSIHGDQSDIAANSALAEVVGHSKGDRNTLDVVRLRDADETFLIKTHDTLASYMSARDDVIYIVRDGRDATASYLKYMHNILKITNTTLSEIITGNIAFGTWGNHVLRWSQDYFNNIHRFKFEDIIANPDKFADELSDILNRSRSREKFPDFARFKSIYPNFFGSGKTGTFSEVFSPTDIALFDIFNGPAMRMAGYWQDYPNSEEIAAYSIFCSRIVDARKSARQLSELEGKHQKLLQEKELLLRENEELKHRTLLGRIMGVLRQC